MGRERGLELRMGRCPVRVAMGGPEGGGLSVGMDKGRRRFVEGEYTWPWEELMCE